MGVPVITLPGLRPVSRQTLGFLSALEMTELVAGDAGEYVAMAVELAGDPRRLTRLRSELRPRMAASPLCDAPRFTAALERTLRNMWLDWCRLQGR
jgi:predicted O-linked N-acetylglucosamine transferase (SPINDLY family)